MWLLYKLRYNNNLKIIIHDITLSVCFIIDSGYCKWLIEQEWCKPELVRTIKYEKEETLKLI